MGLNLNLNLNKPIVFFKTSTTGFFPVGTKEREADRIIEISITKINTDRTVESGTRLINPGRPIPPESTAVHGITDADVSNVPQFKDIANGLFSFIGDSDIAGFNISTFDIKFLSEEFNKAGIPFSIIGRNVIDLSTIFNQMEKRNFKSAANKYAGFELGEEHIQPEVANNISINILNGMVSQYSGDERFVGANPQKLNESFNRHKGALDSYKKIILNEEGKPVFNFGKYKGLVVSDMLINDNPYYQWCTTASDLPAETKVLMKRIVDKARMTQAASNVQTPNNQ